MNQNDNICFKKELCKYDFVKSLLDHTDTLDFDKIVNPIRSGILKNTGNRMGDGFYAPDPYRSEISDAHNYTVGDLTDSKIPPSENVPLYLRHFQ